MEKSQGISKAIVLKHIDEGYRKVKAFFESSSKNRPGAQAELLHALNDFHRKIIAVLDDIEGDRVVYDEDLRAICEEIQAGVREVRNGWKNTSLSHLQKPFSVLVSTYTAETCDEVRKAHEFKNRPAGQEESAGDTAGNSDVSQEDAARGSKVARDMYDVFDGAFEENPEDVENFYIDQILSIESNWAQDVVASLQRERFVNRSGSDSEIVTKDTLSIILNFFSLIAGENHNLRMFMRHSYDQQKKCDFEAFKAYWSRLLHSITRTKIQGAFAHTPESQRLVELLYQAVTGHLVTFVQALDIGVFHRMSNGSDHKINAPLALVMPKKSTYVAEAEAGTAPQPLEFSPAEHAMRKRAQKDGLPPEDVANLLNDMFHGALSVRDAEMDVIRSPRGSMPMVKEDRSKQVLAEAHSDVLRSFSQQIGVAFAEKLLEKFYCDNVEHSGDGQFLPLFINKQEFEALRKVIILLQQTVQRYFARLHGMLGNSRRLERFFTDQREQFQGELQSEVRAFMETSEEFSVFFDPEETCLSVGDLDLDYRTLVGKLHDESTDDDLHDIAEGPLVFSLLLGDRYREGFDDPLYPQERALLGRYMSGVNFEKGQDVESVFAQFAAEDRFQQWSQNINNSLHGGYPVRKSEHLAIFVRDILEEKFRSFVEEQKNSEFRAVEQRLNFLGKDIKEVIRWLDEVQFSKRRRKGFLYDMVDLYANVLRTVDLEGGKITFSIDVIEFQILPFLMRVKKNHEDDLLRRKADRGEEDDDRNYLRLKISPEDLAELMADGPNKKVETDGTTPVTDKLAFTLKTLDQKISSCIAQINAVACDLALIERKQAVLASKVAEREGLQGRISEFSAGLASTKLKIRTLLLDEDFDEKNMAPLLEAAQSLSAQIQDMKTLVGGLEEEIAALRSAVLPFDTYAREQQALQTRWYQLIEKRERFLEQMDQLIISLNHD